MNPHLKKRKPSIYRSLKCHRCSTPFKGNHSQSKYCSKRCAREGMRISWVKYNEKNRASRSEYQRALYKKNAKEVISRTRAYQKTPRGKQAVARSYQNQKRKFPERVAARQMVRIAIVSGKLIRKPCEVCGNKKVHAHHPDYFKPLSVRWLCVKHHFAIHKVGIVISDGEVVPPAL